MSVQCCYWCINVAVVLVQNWVRQRAHAVCPMLQLLPKSAALHRLRCQDTCESTGEGSNVEAKENVGMHHWRACLGRFDSVRGAAAPNGSSQRDCGSLWSCAASVERFPCTVLFWPQHRGTCFPCPVQSNVAPVALLRGHNNNVRVYQGKFHALVYDVRQLVCGSKHSVGWTLPCVCCMQEGLSRWDGARCDGMHYIIMLHLGGGSGLILCLRRPSG